MRKKISNLILVIGVTAFFITLWTVRLIETSQTERLKESVITSAEYREQNITEEMLIYLQESSNPGRDVSLYLLESKFGYQRFHKKIEKNSFEDLVNKWEKQDAWNVYLQTTSSIWNDVQYFPVPESTSNQEYTVSYENAWMTERSYGGKRGHEGTDLMAKENERGLYPIISMTDGIVTNKGWLEKGGYRIGVKAPGGAYFYYAHLDSYAAIEIGDEVKAGDVLGFMGDSGYGVEGTVGQFAVHLHLGIYIYPEGEEVSVNPYWVLRYIENKKVKCYTEE